MSFWKWLNQAPKEDFGVKPEESVKPEPKSWFEEEMERERKNSEKRRKAATEFREKADAAMAEFVCTDPAFKIVQATAGHYEILRRAITNAADYYARYSLVGVSVYDKAEPAPIVSYRAVSNPEAPIVTREQGSYGRYDTERTTGYKPMLFNAFEDAEAYLMRMLKTDVAVAEYDFPPLKKRPVKRAKKATQS